MPIYKRCLKCTTDNKVNHKQCSKCLTLFHGSKSYRYRIKVKVDNSWKTKLLPRGITLKTARESEVELLYGRRSDPQSIEAPTVVQPVEAQPLDFQQYYSYAQLTKITYKADLHLYNNHLKGNDWQTSKGILRILAKAKTRGLAPQTVRHVFNLIRRIHNFYIENATHSTGVNPCKTIRLPKVDNKVTNALSLEECKGLLDYLKFNDVSKKNVQMSMVVSLALLTGRRQGEILGLLREDIDLERGSITCRNTKSGKTLSFPVNEEVVEWLSIGLDLKWHDERLFNYSSSGVQANWKRLRARLLRDGVLSKSIRFHDLRHSHATLLANQGISLYVIQRLLGHSTIELTQRYAHLNDKTMRDAVSGLL
ncbi:MAG: site-specific recombinase XerD [Desulforhopalus sp.]|jgi:site-specific recombinase XerD